MNANQSPVSVLDNSDIYDRYLVTIVMRGKLCGGIPKNKEIIADWIKARTGFDDEKTADQISDMQEHVDEQSEKSWIGFYQVDGKPHIECRGIKAMFKECATVLRLTEKKRGCKQVFQHGFEVKGLDGSDVIPINGKVDSYESVCHAMTPQGPRSSLKKVDYVENEKVEFQVLVLKTASQETRHIGEADIKKILAFAQENGLGADRSQGKGKFVVTEFVAMQESSEDDSTAAPTPSPKKPKKAAVPKHVDE